jgi:hypothetical protein
MSRIDTRCDGKNGWQVFTAAPQMIATGGNVTTNQQVANTTTETAVITETVHANTLDATGMSFRVFLAGEISSTGTGDCTFTLRYGTTDIVAVATVSLADEDDIPFRLEFTGHVLTAGATGKVLATGVCEVFQGTQLNFAADTANTGTTVNLTAAGSINVTAHWDAASADNDVIVTHGWIEFFNA